MSVTSNDEDCRWQHLPHEFLKTLSDADCHQALTSLIDCFGSGYSS
jgi:hypothetical protein